MSCEVCSKECIQRCGKCKKSYFCSRECQAKAWPKHKQICGAREDNSDIPVFDLKNSIEQKKFGEYVKRRGFGLIKWKDTAKEVVEEAAKSVRDFFLQSFEYKRNHGAGPGVGQKHGYMDLDNVEVFEVKDWYDKRFQWPDERLKTSLCRLSKELKEASIETLKILVDELGIDWTCIEEKLDGNHEKLENASQTTLRCLLYAKPKKGGTTDEHLFQTGNHTDNSLITVAPCASIKGLELLPFDCSNVQEFINIEDHMKDNELCVFVGDSLGKLSGGVFPSVIHRPNEQRCVEAFKGVMHDEMKRRKVGRISFPFFLRAKRNAILNTITMAEEGKEKVEDVTVEQMERNFNNCRQTWPWKIRNEKYYKLQIFHKEEN